MSPNHPEPSHSADVFSGSREVAREQLDAAWQLQVERAREQLEDGWRGLVDRILDDRFGELEQRFESELLRRVEDRLDSEREAAAARAAREVSERLNQAVRAIRAAQTEDGRSAALLDGSRAFAARSALLSVASGAVTMKDGRGVACPATSGSGEIPVAAAPAIASVVESRDPLVAAGSPGQISEALATAFGTDDSRKLYLFPVVCRQKVVGILCAVAGDRPVNTGALELLAAEAGAIQEADAPSRASNLVALVQQIRDRAQPGTESWAGLSREEKDVHLKAQRFARVQVAEMRLYKSEAVKNGRANRDLYKALKVEIDAGRESFRRQFLDKSKTMVDYLHLELLRTLANEDVALLGPDYPGPLGQPLP